MILGEKSSHRVVDVDKGRASDSLTMLDNIIEVITIKGHHMFTGRLRAGSFPAFLLTDFDKRFLYPPLVVVEIAIIVFANAVSE